MKYRKKATILLAAFIIALCMLALMYVMLLLCEAAFDLDCRFIWPFF